MVKIEFALNKLILIFKIMLEHHLNPKALGMSLGVFWGAILAFFAIITFAGGGYGSFLMRGLESIYIGYHPHPFGIVTGFIWGFLDGFIAGYIIAYFYNHFNKK